MDMIEDYKYIPTNREKVMKSDKRKWWCDCCDACHVGDVGKCPVCGHIQNRKKKRG